MVPAVWSTVIWTVVFYLALVVAAAALGAGPLLPMLMHPGRPEPLQDAGRILSGMLGMMVLFVLAGPFWMAGIYGLIGAAVTEQPVTWSSFWAQGARDYGRGWGMLLYSALFGIAWAVATFILTLLIHQAGVFLAIVGTIFIIPWMIRMIGGLFVAKKSWGTSFADSFHGGAYWGVLGGVVLVSVVAALLFMVIALIIHFSAGLGIVLLMAAEIALAVANVVWMLALYQAEQTLASRSVP